MTNIKTTKRALLSSTLALFLCFAMLLGTTFAWFTDTVTSNNNIITAGNLDVEFKYAKVENGTLTAWDTVSGKDNIFDKNALWEPGRVEVVYLKVSNLGTLNLKYQLGVKVNSETPGVNVEGNPFKLSDYLVFKVVEMPDALTTYTDREAAELATAGTAQGLKDYNGKTTALDAKGGENDVDYVALIVYMPETVGNEANYRLDSANSVAPFIDLGINLFATQYNKEADSFGDDYDEDAWGEGFKVTTAGDLKAAIANGETNIVLEKDIELTESIVIPAVASTFAMRSTPNAVKIDLNGKTLSNPNGYVIENKGNVVITGNGTIAGLGGIRSTAGKVTIESGNFYSSSRWQDGVYQHTLKAENSVVEINGGNFNATVNGQTNVMFNASENAVITINGGNFKNVEGNLTAFDPYIFTYEKNGKVVINDGTFYGGWRFNGETTTTEIYGGTFNVGFDGQSFHATSTHVVTVYGGTFAAGSKLAGKLDVIVAGGYKAVENADGTYTVLKGDVVAGDNTALNGAIANGESNIALGKGEFSMPTTNGDVIISGTLDTVITIDKPTANNITLNGVTVVGSGHYTGIQHSNKVVYENCVIKGVQFLYANEVTFINCTIDLTEVVDYIWTYGAKNVTFDKCVFNTNGKAILVYSEDANLVTNVTVKNCTFNATESALAGGNVAAAIEIDSSLSKNGHYTLTTENNTVDADFSGEWRIKKSGTNNTTVNGVIYNKVEDGLYKDDKSAFYVYNANGLATMNTMMADKTAGKYAVVNLIADIDFSGKTWTPVDSHADTAFYLTELNGNGHTISNMTINGQAMFTRFAGFGDVTIKDITFDNATVNSNGKINTSILTVQSYQNVLLDNVDVKNSTIVGGYKVAPLIATVYNESSSTITATLKNCDVENVTVKATTYDFCTTGMVAFVNAGDNDKIEFENCTITNVKLYAPNVYTAHAAVYTTGSGTLFDNAEGVIVTNVTFENI